MVTAFISFLKEDFLKGLSTTTKQPMDKSFIKTGKDILGL
jgi:hypothetical protein